MWHVLIPWTSHYSQMSNLIGTGQWWLLRACGHYILLALKLFKLLVIVCKKNWERKEPTHGKRELFSHMWHVLIPRTPHCSQMSDLIGTGHWCSGKAGRLSCLYWLIDLYNQKSHFTQILRLVKVCAFFFEETHTKHITNMPNRGISYKPHTCTLHIWCGTFHSNFEIGEWTADG